MKIVYADFGPRLLASIIDGLIIGLPIALFTFVFLQSSLFSEESAILYEIITSLIMLAYKPLMEYYKMQTVGKMAMRIKVISGDLKRITLRQAFLRIIFEGSRSAINLLIAILAFPIFLGNDLESLSNLNNITTYFGYLITALMIIDIIIYFTDINNKGRSLHDRIANTVVISNDSVLSNEIEQIGQDDPFSL